MGNETELETRIGRKWKTRQAETSFYNENKKNRRKNRGGKTPNSREKTGKRRTETRF